MSNKRQRRWTDADVGMMHSNENDLHWVLAIHNSAHCICNKASLTGMRISRDCFSNLVTYNRTTFVQVSHECRENFHVPRTGREGFKHV